MRCISLRLDDTTSPSSSRSHTFVSVDSKVNGKVLTRDSNSRPF